MSFAGLASGGVGGRPGMMQTRGRMQGGSHQGLNYPNPFFDIAHTYLPTTVKEMFKYCRYYFLTNPLINATVFKLSEYPITDIIIDHEDALVKRRWEQYFHDHLQFRPFQVECGLDYNAYGNCLSSLSFPFAKHLTCRICSFSERADKIRDRWTFTNFGFRLNCPGCGTIDEASVRDVYYKNASGIKLVRWNVEDVEITYNDLTGESTHFYNIPGPLRSDIVIGKKDVVESTPQIFIQALRQQKGIVFSKDNLFHLKRPTLATQDRGWGIPLILPVLKDAFYLQLMKKAQETILLEHVIPLRVLFPQAASGTSDPFTNISLSAWKEQVSAEIARWRHDCVSPESLVEVDDGVVHAVDVSEGMLLRNHLGGYSTVEKVWRRPLREGEKSYRVHARGINGVAPVVSEGHPFLAARSLNQGNGHKLGAATFVRAKDLCAGDYIGCPTALDEVPFEYIDLAQLTDRACTADWCYVDHTAPGTPEAFEMLESGVPYNRSAVCSERKWSVNQLKAAHNAIRAGRALRRLPRYVPVTADLLWTFGLYLAEGSVSSRQVLFAANKAEKYEYQRVYTTMRTSFGANGFVSDKGGEGCQHVFSSTVAAQVFSILCGGTATTKRIHPCLMHLPLPLRPHLVEGMFFGDGCEHADGRSDKRTYTSASSSLACGLQRILLSLHVAAGISYMPSRPYNIQGRTGQSSGSYRVGVYGPSNTRLSSWFRGLEGTDVQVRMGVFRDGYFWYRVTDVEEEYTSEVIGFQLSQENACVRLEDDTEAHGTFCLAGMACANSNYIPIMPLPLGNQSIGGDGKALLLYQEMQMHSEELIMGMGVPREFLQGGLSYSGTNVSMRMLENAFIGYILRQKLMANWVMKMVANYMEWPEATIRFKPFKMADDIQRKAYMLQLNQSQKISDTTLLSDSDLNQSDEDEIMMRETDKRLASTKKQQLAMAEVQGEAQLIMMKHQAKAQMAAVQERGQPAPGEAGGPSGKLTPEQAAVLAQEAQASQQMPMGGAGLVPAAAPPPQPGGQTLQGPVEAGGAPPQVAEQQLGGAVVPELMGPQSDANLGGMPQEAQSQLNEGQRSEQGAVDIHAVAQHYAQQISQLPAEQQSSALQVIHDQSPELAQIVQHYLSMLSSSPQTSGPRTDSRPLPEQRPERRTNPSV